MDTGLAKKKALITGGGTGIGRAIALALAAEGVDVAIASRNPPEQTAREITALGSSGICIRADVSAETGAVGMVREAIERLGGLDIYVNNAAWAWHEPVTKVTSKGWYTTINTNLSACVWACREISKHMIAQAGGSILIVGSTASVCPVTMDAASLARQFLDEHHVHNVLDPTFQQVMDAGFKLAGEIADAHPAS